MAGYNLQVGFDEDPDLEALFPRIVSMETLIPDSHEFLFQFLDYKLSIPEEAMHAYLACLDNVSEPDRQLRQSAFAELQQIHPYFRLSSTNTAAFLNRIFAGYIKTRFSELPDDQQKVLFQKICVTEYSFPINPEYYFDFSIGAGCPFILDYLFNLQRVIRIRVFLTIDDTNPELASLSRERRSALYGFVSSPYDSSLSIELEFSTLFSNKLKKKEIRWDFAHKDYYGELYRDLDALVSFDPSGSIPSTVQQALNAAKDVDGSDIITYKLRDFSNLLELEVHRLLLSGARVRRCKNCNNYFIIERENQEYCGCIAPDATQPCAEIGQQKENKRKEKNLGKKPEEIYHNAYNAHQNKVRRGTLSEETFRQWVDEAKKKTQLVKEGKMDILDFVEWVKI